MPFRSIGMLLFRFSPIPSLLLDDNSQGIRGNTFQNRQVRSYLSIHHHFRDDRDDKPDQQLGQNSLTHRTSVACPRMSQPTAETLLVILCNDHAVLPTLLLI